MIVPEIIQELYSYMTGIAHAHESQVHEIGGIQMQKDHHKNISFQDEYIAFLKKYRITYDEKYVWD
jgi:hypothetical protein